ncbi:presequence translocated-associated motor subunit PAM17 [Aspergillus tubingensis]|uniref:Presequence translocated-associated motor subunit PAM17 n=1 Tax=Aspergillus niger TaxID=5061 RepID=A0A100I369_ASPNG|nr:presequence translocase-associated motor subunit Pam17 [Aspergillus tubingensis]GAQ33869.1 presequence translocase-associated motor subunit Pam17 [Aspergillus niger]GFN15694.1 presequence translocase-associated motor subunit Pam17 [Aspergillus tubingensis]GLA94902.1 TIM23 complex component [Aspergillus tubingensis]GLB15255.1 TIM23 complex component [Aspergillus tubingensis]
MHAPSISGMRTAMLSGRLTSKTLGPFAHPSSCTNPLYQALTQARTASTNTSSMRVRSTQTLKTTTALRPSTTTQLPTSLVLRRANSSAAAAAKSEAVRLDWDSFFKLRASRRRYSLASSIVSSLFTTVIGVQVLSTQDLESLGAQVMGLDPFVVLGMATAACGAAGWLVGPFVGNAVWGLVYRRYKPAVMVKEKEFFDRIRRFRVDPSSNSIANPVPDYYGEKIGSVQGYRQWLKDQRAYNRKRRHFIV